MVDICTVDVVVISTLVTSNVAVVVEVSDGCVVGNGAAVDSYEFTTVCSTVVVAVISDIAASDVSTIDATVEVDGVVVVEVSTFDCAVCCDINIEAVVCDATVTGAGSFVAIKLDYDGK